MKEVELKSFLISDYIYLPFSNKEEIILRSDGLVYKNDTTTIYKDKQLCSPVSGRISGISEINSMEGKVNVLVIENDFKDDISKKVISKKDIYEIDTIEVRSIVDEVLKNNKLVLNMSSLNDIDFKDEFLLRESIIDVLETLNLIEQTYLEVQVKIRLDKRNISIYQMLFSYMGTYPNIQIEFSKSKEEETEVFLYDIIDLFNKIKNKLSRDFVFVTVRSSKSIDVVKVKRYSNLKDLLEYLNLMSTNILINEKLRIENGNFLLDDSVRTVNIL